MSRRTQTNAQWDNDGGRISRLNSLYHYPFKDERGSVADVLRGDRSDSLFLKMAKPARRRFASKVFEELSIGKGKMLMTDVPVALKSLGLQVPTVLEKACRRLSRSGADAKVNFDASEMKIDLQQWFRIIQRCVFDWDRRRREASNHAYSQEYIFARGEKGQSAGGGRGTVNAYGVSTKNKELRDGLLASVSSDISGDLSAEESVYFGTEDEDDNAYPFDDSAPWFPSRGNEPVPAHRRGEGDVNTAPLSSHTAFMLQSAKERSKTVRGGEEHVIARVPYSYFGPDLRASTNAVNRAPFSGRSSSVPRSDPRRYKPQHHRSGIYAIDPRDRYQGIGYQYQDRPQTVAQTIRRQPDVASRIADQVRADRAAWHRERRSVTSSALNAVAKQRVDALLTRRDHNEEFAAERAEDDEQIDRVEVFYKEPRRTTTKELYNSTSFQPRIQTAIDCRPSSTSPAAAQKFSRTTGRYQFSAPQQRASRLRDITSGAATLQIADAFLNGPLGREVTSTASALQYFLNTGTEYPSYDDGDNLSAESPLLDSEPSEVLASKIMEFSTGILVRDAQLGGGIKTSESVALKDACGANSNPRRTDVHAEKRRNLEQRKSSRQAEEEGVDDQRRQSGEQKGGEEEERQGGKGSGNDSSDLSDIDDLINGFSSTEPKAAREDAAEQTRDTVDSHHDNNAKTRRGDGVNSAATSRTRGAKTAAAHGRRDGDDDSCSRDGWSSTGGGWVMDFGPKHTTSKSREAERRANAMQVQRELHAKKQAIAAKAATAADRLVENRREKVNGGGDGKNWVVLEVPASQERHPIESAAAVLPIVEAVESATLSSGANKAFQEENRHFEPKHVDYDGVRHYPTAPDEIDDEGRRKKKGGGSGRGTKLAISTEPRVHTHDDPRVAPEGYEDGDVAVEYEDDDEVMDSSGDDVEGEGYRRRPYFDSGDVDNTGIAAVGGGESSQSHSHYLDETNDVSESTNSTNFGAYADLDTI